MASSRALIGRLDAGRTGENLAVPAVREGCPKRMVYGPCGGVAADGTCEVDGGLRCVFVDGPLVGWDGPTARHRPEVPSGRQPWVVTDLHVRPRDRESLERVAATLSGSCDAVLVGDHAGRRNDFPPSFMAALLLEQGVRPWVTLSCRDRNRVALTAECAALADLGVAGVHCVTGDWQGLAGGAGERRVFDLDSLRLVAVAAEHGLAVSVAATPAAPPLRLRPSRLAEKASAGATSCFVNHCGGPGVVADFVARAREAGAELAYVPCVPVVSDQASTMALARLPGLVLDPQVVEAVGRRGSGPEAGIEAAAAEAAVMLGIPGVVGVNLSGSASTRSEQISAAMMAGLGHRIRRGWSAPPGAGDVTVPRWTR